MAFNETVAPVLDLNGHVLKNDGTSTDAIIEVTGVGLTLQDSSPSVEHKFTVGTDGLYVLNEAEGTVTLKGGCITRTNASNEAGAIIYQTGCKGDGTVITINGGNIVGGKSESTAGDSAGGLYLWGSNTKFIMNGGRIIGCTASTNGYADAVVFAHVNQIIMNGGEINGKTYFRYSSDVINDNLFGTATHYLGDVKVLGTNKLYTGIFYGDMTNMLSSVSGRKITFKKLDGTTYATEIVAAGKHPAEPLSPTTSATTWYTAEGTAFDFSSTYVTSDITLYAGIPTFYTVRYINDESETAKTESVLAGSRLTEPSILSVNENLEIIGWHTVAADNTTEEWEFDTDTVESNITLYATTRSKAGPQIEGLENNKVYTCGTNVEFSVIGEDDVTVVAGTTPLTPNEEGKYTIVAGSGRVTVTVTDNWNRTDSKTVTVNAAHDYGTAYEQSSTEHWKKCKDCGNETVHAAHIPDRDAATYDDPISCTECECELAPKLVRTINQVNAVITPPAFGALPDKDPIFITYAENGCSLYEVRWWRIPQSNYTGRIDDPLSIVDSDETFTAGNYYLCSIMLDVKEGYELSTDVVGRINGKASNELYTSVYHDNFVILNIVFDPLEFDFDPAFTITAVEATVTAPVVGAKPSYTPTINVTPNNSIDMTNIGVYWYKIAIANYTGTDSDSWISISDASYVFEDGYIYSCDIYLDAANGYVVSPDVVGKVNGKNSVITFGNVFDGVDEIYLCIEFDPRQEITSVAATVTAPVLGAKPDVTPILVTTPANALTFSAPYWAKMTIADYEATNGDPTSSYWSDVGSDDVFEAGYYYALVIACTPATGYRLTSSTVCTINGKTLMVERLGSNTIYLLVATFDPLGSSALPLTPQLKFTLNGYEFGKLLGDITLTPDAGNVGYTLSQAGNKYLSDFVMTSCGSDIMSAMSGIYYDESSTFGEKQYYFILLLDSAALTEGYSFAGFTANNIELDGYGKAKFISRQTGSDYSVVCAVFELPYTNSKTVSVPFTKKVTLGDIAAPGKTTFELEIFDLDYTLWLYYPDIKFTATVEIKGRGEFESNIVMTGPASQIEAFLENNAGFYVREKKGDSEKWTYSDAIYYVKLALPEETEASGGIAGATNEATIEADVSIYNVKTTISDDSLNVRYEIGNEVDAMVFENVYTSDSPETGDESNIVLWIALLMLSGMLLVATGLYGRKKHRA